MPSHAMNPANAFSLPVDKQQVPVSATRGRPTTPRQFVNFDQLELDVPSPEITSSTRVSGSSRRSTLKAVGRTLSQGLDKSKATLERSKSALSAATSASKEATKSTASKLKTQFTNAGKTDDDDDDEFLFQRKQLPKLRIPDSTIAVEEALNTPCSTKTEQSPNFALLELSPTSRHLKSKMLDDHPDDVIAEFHNMLSARRRVRKGKFGARVMRYREARSSWDDRWSFRNIHDNPEDRALLKSLTDAVQEQKDLAARIVQWSPRYPGLNPVSAPGCTWSMYQQRKSSYR